MESPDLPCDECGSRYLIFNGDLELSLDMHLQSDTHIAAVSRPVDRTPHSVQLHNVQPNFLEALDETDVNLILTSLKNNGWCEFERNSYKCLICNKTFLPSKLLDLVAHVVKKRHLIEIHGKKTDKNRERVCKALLYAIYKTLKDCKNAAKTDNVENVPLEIHQARCSAVDILQKAAASLRSNMAKMKGKTDSVAETSNTLVATERRVPTVKAKVQPKETANPTIKANSTFSGSTELEDSHKVKPTKKNQCHITEILKSEMVKCEFYRDLSGKQQCTVCGIFVTSSDVVKHLIIDEHVQNIVANWTKHNGTRAYCINSCADVFINFITDLQRIEKKIEVAKQPLRHSFIEELRCVETFWVYYFITETFKTALGRNNFYQRSRGTNALLCVECNIVVPPSDVVKHLSVRDHVENTLGKMTLEKSKSFCVEVREKLTGREQNANFIKFIRARLLYKNAALKTFFNDLACAEEFCLDYPIFRALEICLADCEMFLQLSEGSVKGFCQVCRTFVPFRNVFKHLVQNDHMKEFFLYLDARQCAIILDEGERRLKILEGTGYAIVQSFLVDLKVVKMSWSYHLISNQLTLDLLRYGLRFKAEKVNGVWTLKCNACGAKMPVLNVFKHLNSGYHRVYVDRGIYRILVSVEQNLNKFKLKGVLPDPTVCNELFKDLKSAKLWYLSLFPVTRPNVFIPYEGNGCKDRGNSLLKTLGICTLLATIVLTRKWWWS